MQFDGLEMMVHIQGIKLESRMLLMVIESLNTFLKNFTQ